MEEKKKIKVLLDRLLPICESWIQEKEGQIFFVDPNDGVEISAHYGATHIAATLILYGSLYTDIKKLQLGLQLLKSILDRWNMSKKLPSFHSDFNNFGLCVISDIIQSIDDGIYQRIQDTVLHTEDSDHDTTNWLPMRWYVNKKRYEWTGDGDYLERIKVCRKGIERATNTDGGIEDRMPKGTSFNLQYDVATVGVLQFLRIKGEKYDLSQELYFLLNTVAPDSDINYQGRGTNQIFAWGIWVYLLASTGREDALKNAMEYLEPRVQRMFEKHNLMLNDYDGSRKYLWWDYHYCSVYSAHFLFWLVMSLTDFDRSPIKEGTKIPAETGLHIYRDKESFVAVFDGRKEYLSERGPAVCCLWTQKHGVLFKGTCGPWRGLFGNNHSNEIVKRNFFGIVEVKSFGNHLPSLIKRVVNKCGIHFKEKIETLYCPVNVKEIPHELTIEYCINKLSVFFLNIPLFGEVNLPIEASVDGAPVTLNEVGKIKSQYEWCRLYQSSICRGKKVELTIHY